VVAGYHLQDESLATGYAYPVAKQVQNL
jgi:hypothetical protein